MPPGKYPRGQESALYLYLLVDSDIHAGLLFIRRFLLQIELYFRADRFRYADFWHRKSLRRDAAVELQGLPTRPVTAQVVTCFSLGQYEKIWLLGMELHNLPKSRHPAEMSAANTVKIVTTRGVCADDL
jgi:hypothetical protein